MVNFFVVSLPIFMNVTYMERRTLFIGGHTQSVLWSKEVITVTDGALWGLKYCIFGNFRENYIFAKNVKRQIYCVKNHEFGMIYLYQLMRSVFAISAKFPENFRICSI